MKKSHDTLHQLLDQLNDGDYHDGTRLGEQCHITRSAVWKIIKKLQQYGVMIENVKGKGYALTEPLILLNQERIQQTLHADIDLEIFESVASTNDYLKGFYNQSTKPKVCLAEQMTQGKGRLNRQWHSPFAQNLYYSMLYTFDQDLSELIGLGLMVSVVVQETLNKLITPSFSQIEIKWPNDIVYHQAKISGILIEVQAESHGLCHAIIGIGINVNMLSIPDNSITQAWTSLRKITNHYFDRNHLCAALTNNLLENLRVFSKHGLAAFIDKWRAADCLYAKELNINHCNLIISGIAQGINNKGHLLLKSPDGLIREFSSGDASIVKPHFFQ